MAKKSDKKDEKMLKQNRDEIAKALEILFATDYISKKKLYLENFLRGMAFSAGGIIGATVLIALLLWIMSLFGQIPLVGPLINDTKDTIQQSQNSR